MFKFVAFFCILNCVPIKGSYQTHDGNFITISAEYQIFTDRCVNLRRIFLTQNQEVNIFFSARTFWSNVTCESVECAGVSERYQQPVNATFGPSFV